MTPRAVAVGRNVLIVTTEDFVNGYQAGHLAYMTQGRDTLFTDEQLLASLMEKLEDMDYPERYCVGYVVGWLSTFTWKGMSAQQGGEP